METSNFILKTGKGKNTSLDNAYSRIINNVLNTNDEAQQERWEVYNLIIKELLSIQDSNYFQEIKYRITDGENPNEVLLDVLTRNNGDDVSAFAWSLKRKIEEYIEEDLFL